MELTNLYQVCVFFSVGLMVFTLSVSFIEGTSLFGPVVPSGGMDVSGNQSNVVGNFTRNPEGQGAFSTAFLLAFGGGTAIAALGAIGIAVMTQNATFVGVYIFSVYFWASYVNAFGILSIGRFMPASFLVLISIPVGFVFVGAIAGMLSGV